MNQHTGSNFDDLLEDEGILEEVSARAQKRLLALQLADIMEDCLSDLEEQRIQDDGNETHA